MLAQIVIGFVSASILVAGLFYYHHTVYRDGFEDAQHQYQVREENTRIEAEKRLAEAVQAEKDKRAALQIEINNISEQRQREQDHADAEIKSLRAGLAAGTRRVSIPGTGTCPILGGDPATTAAATSGPVSQARCELAPDTAATLLDIASTGDAAIRQANALIDTYNAARAQQ